MSGQAERKTPERRPAGPTDPALARLLAELRALVAILPPAEPAPIRPG